MSEEFLERLKNPHNPFDKDLKALREGVLFLLDKVKALEGKPQEQEKEVDAGSPESVFGVPEKKKKAKKLSE